jgi:hypothetical protein
MIQKHSGDVVFLPQLGESQKLCKIPELPHPERFIK